MYNTYKWGPPFPPKGNSICGYYEFFHKYLVLVTTETRIFASGYHGNPTISELKRFNNIVSAQLYTLILSIGASKRQGWIFTWSHNIIFH